MGMACQITEKYTTKVSQRSGLGQLFLVSQLATVSAFAISGSVFALVATRVSRARGHPALAFSE